MVAVYDGKVFVSWGEVATKYSCHSIRKCLLSGLYGIHVDRGNIALDKTLAALNIDDIPLSLTDAEKQATVRDLIMSRSGVYHEAAAESQDAVDSRPARGSHGPGTFFYYNNWDFNVAGTIFEQETGTDLSEEFRDRLARPIGMQHYHTEDCQDHYEHEKSMHPAYKFRMTAMDLARYGVLYLKNGAWGDNQIISPGWIAESTTRHSTIPVEIDSVTTVEFGYGYMWHTFPDNLGFGRGGYFHTGIGVHLLAVFPEDGLVLVHRVDTDAAYSTTNEQMWQLVMKIFEARIANQKDG
jgi:CubicO group peptidase (beta-lactamase class C family)